MRTKLLVLLAATSLMVSSATTCSAQDATRARIEQKLNESSRFYAQNDFFDGIMRVNEACLMLRNNPGAMPETNYIALATQTVDDLNARIRNAQSRHDVPWVTRHVYALQPLVNSLSSWEPENPRWHYQKATMFRALSATLNDQYPTHLQSAIQELNETLALSGGGQYRACAQEMLNSCQSILANRKVEIAQFQRTHPVHQTYYQRQQTPQTVVCVFCGHQHLAGFGCPYCGH